MFPTQATSKNFKTCIEKSNTNEIGGAVGVLSSKFGYPVHWSHWEQLLDPKKATSIFKRLEISKTFAVHLWNKKTEGNFESILTPNTPYAQLFSLHCPIIYTYIV